MSSNNSEATSPPPVPSTTKKQPNSESMNNDSSDGRDLLHSLKGQVSFAKQCLGLLQNQMKHAMDTLEILQDQVIKAQLTIEKLERKGSKQSDQKVQPGVSSCDHHSSTDDISPGAVPLHGYRMFVVDSTGQPLYAIDKSAATSYGVPVQHQGGSCHCPSCNNIGLGHPVFITEQNQQLIALHPGQAVYHIDGKPVVSPSSSIHDTNKKSDHQTSSTSDHTSTKKRKHSISDSEDSPKQAASESSVSQNEGKSSPITSQLLQVLDVLQNAGDDESKESVLPCRSSRGATIPFTGPVPLNPVHSASGTGILSVNRRCRKQDMSPFKREEASLLSHLHKTERDYPELMKVPPPVLAATLEPDFLVVPGNSYFSDSPPSSVGGGLRETHVQHERKCSETRASTVIEVKKEHIDNTVEPRRSSSGSSSFSQTSDSSSRSPSESSEKPSSMDAQKRQDTACDIESHINKISDPENISRDQQSHSNGVSSKSNSGATPLDSQVTESTPSRLSLLNSNALEPTSPSQLSPKKSPVRLIKVSPLNSAISGNSGVELRRPSLEYTTNHGIVRISSATSMTSPMTSPKHVSLESSTFSNNMLKNAVTSYVNSDNSDVQMVTTYSVAQISNTDDRECTSPSKRPNILSKNRNQNKKDIPQGIVVLVPTIEDAKQLIKSSGGNQSKTPVLVPQNVLNQISSNGESSKTNADSRVRSPFVEKRPQYADSSLSYSRSKRGLSESMVID